MSGPSWPDWATAWSSAGERKPGFRPATTHRSWPAEWPRDSSTWSVLTGSGLPGRSPSLSHAQRPCGSPGLRRGGELAAGPFDLPAAGIAYGHRHPLGLQPADELVLVLASGGGPAGPGRRVHRDQVDVDPAPVAPPAQYLGQQVGAERLVV